MTKISDLLDRDEGSELIEFALVSLVWITLVFGIITFGYAIYSYNSICSAARASARYAAVHGSASPIPATNAQIQQVAVDAAPAVGLSQSDVTVTWPVDAYLGSSVQVAIVHNYSLPTIVPLKLRLQSTSRMLVTQY